MAVFQFLVFFMKDFSPVKTLNNKTAAIFAPAGGLL